MHPLLSCIAFTLLISTACNQSTKPATESVNPSTTEPIIKNSPTKVYAAGDGLNKLFSIADAVMILGESATITDSTMSTQSNIKAYKGEYRGNLGGEQPAVVRFLIESFSMPQDAKIKYGFIKASYEDKADFKNLSGVGDEAFFQTDNGKAHFIMARKGNNVFNIKVTNISSHTSVDALHVTARRIASTL